MKRIISIVISVLPLFAYAQAKYGNFISENGTVIYHKEFETDQAEIKIKSFIMGAESYTNYSSNNNILKGKLINSTINYQSGGYNRLELPVFMTQPFNANVRIEILPGRYIVTINDFIFVDSTIKNKTYELTEMVIKKKTGEFRRSQFKGLNVFDYDLTDRFSYKAYLGR